MKLRLFSCVLVACCLQANAEDVFLKDGKIIRAQSLRREGNFIFVRVVNSEGVGTESLLQLNQIDRINFREPPALAEARQLAYAGNAHAVLEKTGPLLVHARLFADLPGSLWPDLVRLRLPALAATNNREGISELQKQWTPFGDQDLENAFKLIQSNQPGADPKALQPAWKSQAIPGTPTLSAAIAWMELGKAATEAKQWKDAFRAFLSVEVFVPNQRLLHPAALLGAIRAFVSAGELKEAKIRIEVLRAEFPDSTELKQAVELMPLPPTQPAKPN